MPLASEVRIGVPEQSVSGAIKHAPIGTTLPTPADITAEKVVLDKAFEGNEYVSSDGVTFTPETNVNEIAEWGGSIVRRPLQSVNYNFSWTMISTNASALGVAFGADNVSETAATASHGAQVAVSLGARQPEAQSWVLLMKDGNARVVIVVPNGQVTEVSETTFNSTDAIGWNVTMTAYPDESGNSVYIYTDDGATKASGSSGSGA